MISKHPIGVLDIATISMLILNFVFGWQISWWIVFAPISLEIVIVVLLKVSQARNDAYDDFLRRQINKHKSNKEPVI